jgi:hypothetical protein
MHPRPRWIDLSAWSLLIIVTGLCWWPHPTVGSPLPSDKWDHGATFALLALVFSCGRRHAWAWTLGVIAWGGVIELVQPYVGRSGEWLDLAADAAGALGGLAVLSIPPLAWLHRRWRRPVGGP